jgi:hypothetical protein
MKLPKKVESKVQLHSNDVTFCGIDVYPPEIYEDPINDDRITYTGVIIPQPEFFEGFAQWKDTGDLAHRIEILKSILALVSKEEARTVLCFTIFTSKENGWLMGKMMLTDLAKTNPKIEAYETNKGKQYKIKGEKFGERHAITLFSYALVLATMFQHIAREVTKAKSLKTLQKPVLQMLLDNVSGDPAPNTAKTPRYLKLIHWIIDNSRLFEVTKRGLSKSCFTRFGISVPVANKIEDQEEIVGHNNIPLMIAADWFTKICSRYRELDPGNEDLAEDDKLITDIMHVLRKRKCLIQETIPMAAPEEEWE